MAFYRYGGTLTMWYRPYHRTGLWLGHSRMVVSPSGGLGGSTAGETTFLCTNQHRNGRAFSSLTARGGGLPIGVTRRSCDLQIRPASLPKFVNTIMTRFARGCPDPLPDRPRAAAWGLGDRRGHRGHAVRGASARRRPASPLLPMTAPSGGSSASKTLLHRQGVRAARKRTTPSKMSCSSMPCSSSSF
jgi:hypothetical protein